MRVLFLALGANRRLAVTEESRALAEAGGHPVVLVDRPAAWAAETFAPGVQVVSMTGLARGRWPAAVEKVVLLRRVVRRLQRRDPERQFHELLRRHPGFEAIVVTDAQSFPAAQSLAARLGDGTRIAFRIDQLLLEEA
jgi:hypothetical protein